MSAVATFPVPSILEDKVLARERKWCEHSAADVRQRVQPRITTLLRELESDIRSRLPKGHHTDRSPPVFVTHLPLEISSSVVPLAIHQQAVQHLVRPLLRRLEARDFSVFMDKSRTLRAVSEWNSTNPPTIVHYLHVFRDALDCEASLQLGEGLHGGASVPHFSFSRAAAPAAPESVHGEDDTTDQAL